MKIEISHKEINDLRRLGKCLDNGIIPIDDLKKMVKGLWQKTQQARATTPTPRKRENLKDKYRLQL